MSTACSFPLSWHQRSCALCGVLPSPPCCACGSGACRLHAESVLPLVLSPTLRPQFNAACDRPPCLMLLFFPRPPCPALLLLPLLPLFCSSFLSLFTVCFAVDQVRFTAKKFRCALVARTSGTDARVHLHAPGLDELVVPSRP